MRVRAVRLVTVTEGATGGPGGPKKSMHVSSSIEIVVVLTSNSNHCGLCDIEWTSIIESTPNMTSIIVNSHYHGHCKCSHCVDTNSLRGLGPSDVV